MAAIIELEAGGGCPQGPPGLRIDRASVAEHLKATALPGPRKSNVLDEDAANPSEVTQLLLRVKRGENGASEQLLRCVYRELHELANGHMRAQRREHTLQATALVNEAYLRMFRSAEPGFSDRNHFLRVASRAMRCVLVDHAREKGRLKRTAGGQRLPLEELGQLFEEGAEDLVALDAALARLGETDARAVQVVELRFFGGRTEEEIAAILDVSLRTVERDWNAARAWLHRELS